MDVWQAIVRGKSGIAPLTAIESTLEVNKQGGQAPPLDGGHDEKEPRETAYLRLAMADALRDAGAGGSLPYAPDRCGIVMGTTLHGMRCVGQFLRSNDLEELRWFLAGGTLHRTAKDFGLEGLALTVCSACSSGLASVAMAVTLLRTGRLDLVVAGGYDPVSEYAYGGFNCMRLMTGDRIKPFGKGRDGLKLGEGYGVVILERDADAVRRGAKVFARVAGVGESCDAFHLSKPHPEGAGAAAAMQNALTSAGVAPEAIDMVSAHATSTPDNDAAEFAALKQTFGSQLQDIPVVSFKSHLGHTLGGAGTVELILSATALNEQLVPPCAEGTSGDVEYEGLDLVTGEARPTTLRHSLNTSLGFGGANACVVLRVANGVAESTSRTTTPTIAAEPCATIAERTVAITGVGVVVPGALSNEAFVDLLDNPRNERLSEDTGSIDFKELQHLLQERRVRRLSDYVKLTLAATTLAYRDAGIDNSAEFGEHCSAVLGTTHGSTLYCERYYRQIVEDGIDAANPLLFAEGVPNAGTAHLSTMLSIKGFCQTVIGTRTAGLDALLLASERIRCGDWDRAVVSAGEEYSPLINSTYQHFGLYGSAVAGGARREKSRLVTGCGAVTLILEEAEAAKRRGAKIRATVAAFASAYCPTLASREGVNTVARVLKEIGDPQLVVGSNNDTWLGRMEVAGSIRRCRSRSESASQPRVLSSMYGHLAECFSVMPLASLAALALRGRMPLWVGSPELGERRGHVVLAARGDERPDSVGVLCSDYTGCVSAARIEIE